MPHFARYCADTIESYNGNPGGRKGRRRSRRGSFPVINHYKIQGRQFRPTVPRDKKEMLDRSRLGRDLIMLIVGAVVAALFAIVVAYPEILAKSRENTVLIEANKEHIELLWGAHNVKHEGPVVEESKER